MKSGAQSFSKIASTLLFQQIGLEIGTFQSSICAQEKHILGNTRCPKKKSTINKDNNNDNDNDNSDYKD